MISVPRILLVLLATWVVCAVLTGSAPPTSEAASSEPIVKVIRHGGLCAAGTECRSVVRITDTAISGPGYISRRLSRTARVELLRDIASLDIAKVRKHPFNGTCPTAFDGAESIYQFRGFPYPLASCTYDLRGVQAVRRLDRLLVALRTR